MHLQNVSLQQYKSSFALAGMLQESRQTLTFCTFYLSIKTYHCHGSLMDFLHEPKPKIISELEL